MKNTGTLFEILQRLDEFDDSDPASPLVIYAQGGAQAARKSPAVVCRRGEGSGSTCPLDPSLAEVLGVGQAREVLEVWSAWRGGLVPSPEDRFRAVLFFSQYGAFFPLETDREGM
jgi:hypothetical protein